jgi:hypothetical protein
LKRSRGTLIHILTAKPKGSGSILKWNMKKGNGEMCAGFFWLKIGTSGRLL